MATSLPFGARAARTEGKAGTRPAAVPWYVWCAVTAITSTTVGLYWDISWHISIGRDTFWTPAHMATYFCGVLAGVSCAYLILRTTFGAHAPARDSAVRLWGFRGPLGAFIAAWGGFAMITSAPFDNWWHNAYGLDVKILSPPHVLLISGMLVVGAGALILVLGDMNRAESGTRVKLERLFFYVSALILVLLLILVFEYVERWFMHNGRCYLAVSMEVPLLLAGVARATGRRWAATTVAGLYSALLLFGLWFLPLFPAQPKLGPVYQHITHFVPMDFPLLIIVPAVVLDLMRQKTEGWNNWAQAALAGAAFFAVFFAVQWPFANFLLSPGARNWFFGGGYMGYNWHFDPVAAQYKFLLFESPALFWTQMALAPVAAVASTRLGLAWGDWMRRIRR